MVVMCYPPSLIKGVGMRSRLGRRPPETGRASLQRFPSKFLIWIRHQLMLRMCMPEASTSAAGKIRTFLAEALKASCVEQTWQMAPTGSKVFDTNLNELIKKNLMADCYAGKVLQQDCWKVVEVSYCHDRGSLLLQLGSTSIYSYPSDCLRFIPNFELKTKSLECHWIIPLTQTQGQIISW